VKIPVFREINFLSITEYVNTMKKIKSRKGEVLLSHGRAQASITRVFSHLTKPSLLSSQIYDLKLTSISMRDLRVIGSAKLRANFKLA